MSNIPIWERKNIKYLRRKIATRGYPKPAILIICEGSKTEPNYFRSFPVVSARVEVIGEGKNTKSLVEQTIKYIKDAKKSGYIFDEVWCVFDKDSFSPDDFNQAIDIARNKHFRVAYSNQAFELWYALHFDYISTPIDRQDLVRRLTRKLGRPYEKNSVDMYRILLNKQAEAIRNARRLLQNYTPVNPARDDPSTTVFELVEELNNFLRC